MAINFPSGPVNGQQFTNPITGIVYVYDTTYSLWKTVSATPVVAVSVSDIAPSSPANNQLWWNSNTGGLYIYYRDNDSSQWVEAAQRKPPQSSPFGYSIIFGGI